MTCTNDKNTSADHSVPTQENIVSITERSKGHRKLELVSALLVTTPLNNCVLVKVWFMVFNAILNNISAVSWFSVLLVEETGVHVEHHRPVASQWQTWSHNVVSSTPRYERDSNSQRFS